jgi:CRISPR-associated protein Cmr5
MNVSTRNQKLAQAAFARVAARGTPDKEYFTAARKFPALIHTCGLAQALVFAQTKMEAGYIEDLATLLKACGHPEITSATAFYEQAQSRELGGYVRLSRDTLAAASWLKRYSEAAGEDE